MFIFSGDIEFPTLPWSRGTSKDHFLRLIQYAKDINLDAVSPIFRNPDGRVENYVYRVLPIEKVELIKKKYE